MASAMLEDRVVSIDVRPEQRAEILEALRRGAVPSRALFVLAVGLAPFEAAIREDLQAAADGRSSFKAVRGDYGSGKTFFARWVEEDALRRGFAVSEVQISETETPLHRLETVYRRLVEHLSTDAVRRGAFRSVIEGWFYILEQDVLADGQIDPGDRERVAQKTQELLESRLITIHRETPMFSVALRAFHQAVVAQDSETADGLLAWLGGQTHVGAKAKRAAGIKGDLDHDGALGFLRGLLAVLADSGHRGLVLVLDEVETLQRMRGDVRDKALNALRQFLDDISAHRFPGLYLVLTGTPAFFDSPQGVQRLPPLAQRLATDFTTEARFDNPRAPQIRLQAFDLQRLEEVGRKVRDVFASGTPQRERILSRVDNTYVRDLARVVTGELGGKVGIAPRLFLKRLVCDVLDRVDLHAEFDPRRHYELTVNRNELTREELGARGALSPDDVDLNL